MRWRKGFSLLVIYSSLIGFSCPAHARHQAAFESVDLTISKWHAYLSYHRFKVDDPVCKTLVITKKTPEKRIRGGFLYFNRRLIPLQDFFRGEETTLHIKIGLKTRNRLMVFFRGAPGATINIRFEPAHLPTEPPHVVF